MSLFDNKCQSIWDSLTSLIDEEDKIELQEFMSAVYIDEDGNEFTIEQLEPADEEESDEEILDEALKRTKVVRGGKKLKKFKTSKEGFKVKMEKGRPKEVKMSSKEKIGRKKAAKKAARTGKAKRKGAVRKRAKSMKRRP